MKRLKRLTTRLFAVVCAAATACALFAGCGIINGGDQAGGSTGGSTGGGSGSGDNNNQGGDQTEKPVAVTGVTLSTADDLTEIKLGTSLQLVCNVSPANATDKTVSYVCDDTAKATVDGYGLVTARALGDFTVTVTSTDGGKTDSINLSVVSNYDYEPHVFTTAPKICINTPDLSNAWATEWGDFQKEWQYVDCTVSIENCEDKYALTDESGKVKVRGNYTATYEKKPFRIKFDKKQSMLGLNGGAKCKSWVLLANYKDVSLVRNSAAFWLGKKILSSDGYYTSDYCDVEVWLNGAYWGSYLLCEQQQVNKNRIDITEPEENYAGTDIGYFVEYDGYYYMENELEQFTINAGYGSQMGYTIKSDIYNAGQTRFIKYFVQNLNRLCREALSGNYLKFNDDYTQLVPAGTTNAEDTIAAVVDIRSLVDTYILNEICCDYDVGWSSFLFDVDFGEDGDKIVRFEAPWDFDSALGLRPACASGVGMYAATHQNQYLSMFIGQEWFDKAVASKWKEMKEAGVIDGLFEYLAELQTTYGATLYAENFQRWNYNGVFNNVSGEFSAQASSASRSGQGGAHAFTCKWLETRLDYLDGVWGNYVEPVRPSLPEAGSTPYRYEAEDCALSGGIGLRTGNGASGDGYLGNVSGGAGKTITFTVVAPKATTAHFAFGISKRATVNYLSNWFALEVNGENVQLPRREVPSTSNEWHDWTTIYGADINLRAGENTIVVSTVSSDATNIDYFDVYSLVALS